MPGLINKENRSALPLSVSDITSCVRGYTLAMTASLTYENIEDHAIEGIFIYPLEENSIVVGFEAMISSQILTLQIKDKSKMEDCLLDCCSSSDGVLQGSSVNAPWPTFAGHILMDEDLERTVLVVNLGFIPPMETVHVLVSTSSELCTLPSGGISVSSPPACTPRVQRTINEEQGLSPNFSRTRPSGVFSPHEQTPSSPQLWLSSLLEEETINSMDYEFNFQLEIRAPYLLAGVESPSHAIRADADPLARSATSVVITLADKYTYDCPVRILIYPSEPHLPHVLVENGDMTLEEYDEYLRGRGDFIKATKKDSSNERKVDIIRRRLHKDILHHPVVMLNFCPDLKSISSDLRKVHGEFIFLVDRSGSMSGVNINRVKDAMVVMLKSLMPGCFFNIVGFGSTYKSLFPTSQNYDEEALTLACEYIRKIRADMGGTNVLDPLSWMLRQPKIRGHPRLLFLLTDGAVSNTGKVIELVRRHARYIRCFTFSIGQNACRRLVEALATVSKGTAEFLADGERLQPKMIKSLKKTMSAVLSDICVEWLFPETEEVLLSPVGNTFLFPGDSLIGYSVVCDTTRYHANPKSDKRRRYSMMRSVESASSVFYHSQEEDALKMGVDTSASRDDSYQESMTDSSPVSRDADPSGFDCRTSPRRRAYSTNQINDYNPAKKVYTPSDPSSVMTKNPLRRTKAQELIGQMGLEHEARWRNDYQPQLASLCATSSSGFPAGGTGPFSLQELIPQQEFEDSDLRIPPPQETPQSINAPHATRSRDDGSRSSTDSPSVDSTGSETFLWERMLQLLRVCVSDCYGHQVCQAETPHEVLSKVVVSGLLCGKPAKWEVLFDIRPYLSGREREEKVHEELWNETFHYLAGRSIIHDFEHMAEKECEIELGLGRKYQLYAVQTSKACNIQSKYTAFIPVDLDTNEYLPTCVEYINPHDGAKRSSHSSSRSGSRKKRGYSIGLGRSQSGVRRHIFTELKAENPAETQFNIYGLSDGSNRRYESLPAPNSVSVSMAQVSQRSPSVTSDQSQKSLESLFSARLALSRTRLLTRAAKGFMCRSHSKSGDSVGESENENKDYIPLVLLQSASGAFPLDTALCEAINVPMDKLKWTSPFSSHRASLSHVSQSSSRRADASDDGQGAPSEPEFCQQPAEPAAGIQSPSHLSKSVCCPGKRMLDTESLIWATAVALAWLEHSSASYFIEWEMIAAKASMWLSAQDIPEGRDLASIKAAANQLFIILRHWDENLQLNMLC
uniref:von Willebrand factor A domain containing 5B1 n=1 Tax=Tetraodon nigroviridis TaxID=99883 RepID=H3D4F0_TETNG